MIQKKDHEKICLYPSSRAAHLKLKQLSDQSKSGPFIAYQNISYICSLQNIDDTLINKKKGDQIYLPVILYPLASTPKTLETTWSILVFRSFPDSKGTFDSTALL